jgi:hypothetical protein
MQGGDCSLAYAQLDVVRWRSPGEVEDVHESGMAESIYVPERLRGSEVIKGLEGTTISDFFSWAYSDLLSNTVHPMFAEFLVGSALGITDRPREEWRPFDFSYRNLRIEVKSSSNLQSWRQKKESTIQFDIAPRKRTSNAETKTTQKPEERHSDCYIFCCLNARRRDVYEVMDTDNWKFYVIRTSTLDMKVGAQKSIRLNPLSALVKPVSLSDLKVTVDRIAESQVSRESLSR